MLIYDNKLVNVMNAIPTTVLLTCLLLSFTIQCCAATTVSITDATVEPEGVVTIPIMISDITDYGSGTINIEYDPSVVHVTDVTDSPDSQVPAYNANNTMGLVRISAANVYGASGNIIFANVEFTAVGTGSTPLNLDVVSLINRSFEDVSATSSAGSFTISVNGQTSTPDGGSSGGSTIGTISISTPTPTPTPTSTPAETPQLNEDGAHPTPTHEPTSHDEETSTSPHTPSTVKPTPNSQMSSPGFEIVYLIIGLLIASLILKRSDDP
jgi:hypothetical protein